MHKAAEMDGGLKRCFPNSSLPCLPESKEKPPKHILPSSVDSLRRGERNTGATHHLSGKSRALPKSPLLFLIVAMPPTPSSRILGASEAPPNSQDSGPGDPSRATFFSGKKTEPKPKLFGPDVFGWGGGQKVRYVLRKPGKPNFLAGYPGISAGISRGAGQVCEKEFSSPIVGSLLTHSGLFGLALDFFDSEGSNGTPKDSLWTSSRFPSWSAQGWESPLWLFQCGAHLDSYLGGLGIGIDGR